ncbi:MAG: hypothetical protein NXI31_09025 [bacterium]|nr:hypothetical protein [bacterium]
MTKDQNESGKGSKDADEEIGSGESCLWNGDVKKHGEIVCDPDTGREKVCKNGVWVDTKTEC